MSDIDETSTRCVLCDQAVWVSTHDGGGAWVVSMRTPPDCPHELLDGRT